MSEASNTPKRLDSEAFLDANRCPKCGEQPAWAHARINELIVFKCPVGHRYTDRFGDLRIRMVVGDEVAAFTPRTDGWKPLEGQF